MGSSKAVASPSILELCYEAANVKMYGHGEGEDSRQLLGSGKQAEIGRLYVAVPPSGIQRNPEFVL